MAVLLDCAHLALVVRVLQRRGRMAIVIAHTGNVPCVHFIVNALTVNLHSVLSDIDTSTGRNRTAVFFRNCNGTNKS